MIDSKDVFLLRVSGWCTLRGICVSIRTHRGERDPRTTYATPKDPTDGIECSVVPDSREGMRFCRVSELYSKYWILYSEVNVH